MCKLVLLLILRMPLLCHAQQESGKLECSFFLSDRPKRIEFSLGIETKLKEAVDVVLHKLDSAPKPENRIKLKALKTGEKHVIGVSVMLWPSEKFLEGWKTPMSISEYGTYMITFSRNLSEKKVEGGRILKRCVFEVGEQAGIKFVKIKQIENCQKILNHSKP